jgi:hypothetical protein
MPFLKKVKIFSTMAGISFFSTGVNDSILLCCDTSLRILSALDHAMNDIGRKNVLLLIYL